MTSSPFPITAGAGASSAAALPVVDFRSTRTAHAGHTQHGHATGAKPESVSELLSSALGDQAGALPVGVGASLLTGVAAATGAGAAGGEALLKRGQLIDTQA
jgi:hypothetical protein